MNMLKTILPLLLALLLWTSCTTESSFASLENAFSASTDTLRFDTVFTRVGSITQTIKLFNKDADPLRIESIQLGGGTNSSFQINVNGKPGPRVNAITIPGNDSLYVFVTVRIDPNNQQLPFLVKDSIQIQQAQQTRSIQLLAYGQNAIYLKHAEIATNTNWNATLPYVIEGSLWIQNGATLTIQKGARIHVNASAPIIVDGTIRAIGTKKDSITFQGDRLDKDYRAIPGSWPGIYFRKNSQQNLFQYTNIYHAYQGLVVGKQTGTTTKLLMEQCIINNCYETGLVTNGSTVDLTNCLISNCGSNMIITGGGQYSLNHCMLAAYSTSYIEHKEPTLYITNWDSTTQINSYDTKLWIRNSVIWGEGNTIEDEIQFVKKGNTAVDVRIENCLYKAKTTLAWASVAQNIVNQSPAFDSIDAKSMYFDFHLQKGRSPLINKGKSSQVMIDLDGQLRDNQPDIGCYEKQ